MNAPQSKDRQRKRPRKATVRGRILPHDTRPGRDQLVAEPARMAHYCQATGDTPNAVHARRKKRQWLDGVQCKIAPDGNVWINIDEVNRWVESKGQEAAT